MPLESKVLDRIDRLLAKGQAVLNTYKPAPQNVIGPGSVGAEEFAEWRTQVLSFLTNLLGPGHVYVQSFETSVKGRRQSEVKTGQGILRAVREDVEGGYLTDVRTLVSAEVFTDFLDMAQHLHENGYKDPAASLIGAVLEDGLRRVAETHGLQVKSRDDIGALNQRIADAQVYNRLTQKKVQVWNDIRNSADHGKFDEYSAEDVASLLTGVNDFLANHLSS